MGLAKEVCLHAGADWLKLICQSEEGERSIQRPPTVSPVSLLLPFLCCTVIIEGHRLGSLTERWSFEIQCPVKSEGGVKAEHKL